MEVGSSSLPGTTHRTTGAMCTGSKSAWDYTSHGSVMYMGSVGVEFNIVDNNIKLYQSLIPFIWGISSVG